MRSIQTGQKIPNIQDPALFLQAGIDPKTGLPIKVGLGSDCGLKDDIFTQVAIKDEQDAINRYKVSGHPFDLTSQDIERLIYFKYQLAMFYVRDLDEFYIMPFALDGGIDFYGRFKQIHPIPVAEGENTKAVAQYLSTLKLKPLYDIPIKPLEGNPEDYCVIVRDYTPQLAINSGIPRANLQQGVFGPMSDLIPFMRTNLLNQTGVHGFRVGSPDEASQVDYTAKTIKDHALEGNPYVAMVGGVDFQELTGNSMGSAQDYMAAFQSLDNYRQSLLGLGDGSLYQKKAQMLQAEVGMMSRGSTNAQLMDGLLQRQHAADLCNFLWGTNMVWEISEQAAGGDIDMNGFIGDRDGMPNGSDPVANGDDYDSE